MQKDRGPLQLYNKYELLFKLLPTIVDIVNCAYLCGIKTLEQ